MLKQYIYSDLSSEDIDKIIARNTDDSHTIQATVQELLTDVKNRGDQALKDLAFKFDKVTLNKLYLDADEILELAMTIGRDQQRALEIAFQNIHKFHSIQQRRERRLETMPGVKCWRESRPIEKVGLYIPGGTAVLPSTL